MWKTQPYTHLAAFTDSFNWTPQDYHQQQAGHLREDSICSLPFLILQNRTICPQKNFSYSLCVSAELNGSTKSSSGCAVLPSRRLLKVPLCPEASSLWLKAILHGTFWQARGAFEFQSISFKSDFSTDLCEVPMEDIQPENCPCSDSEVQQTHVSRGVAQCTLCCFSTGSRLVAATQNKKASSTGVHKKG